MDSDEAWLMLMCTAGGLVWLIRQAHRVLRVTSLGGGREDRIPWLFFQPICLAALWLFIVMAAAREVRETVGYQLLFVSATVVGLAVATVGFSILGIDAVVDGVERNNRAARVAVGGLWMAITICSGGANIGEGDSVVTTLAPLALAVLLLLAFTAAYSAATGGFAAIVIEHNVWAGLRFAGGLIACSLPLAWAASGDWVSVSRTLADFGSAVPLLFALLALGIFFERRAAAVRMT